MTDVQVSAAIDSKVAERAMLKHPFYQAWTEGRLPLDTLRGYARQYFHHVEAFPRAVSAVHSACPDRAGRRMLAENLAEEEGLEAGKQDHASLWLMFARGLGESEEAVRAQELNAETLALIAAFRKLSRQSYAAGLGALYAYESQFPGVASAKIEGLIDRYGIEDEETLRFFRVHESADVEHSAVCRALLDRLPEAQKAEAAAAGEELAAALWNFLSGVEARAPVH
jgi:pyrroloquinoline-quinone synthase